jgi:hypothetical protein
MSVYELGPKVEQLKEVYLESMKDVKGALMGHPNKSASFFLRIAQTPSFGPIETCAGVFKRIVPEELFYNIKRIGHISEIEDNFLEALRYERIGEPDLREVYVEKVNHGLSALSKIEKMMRPFIPLDEELPLILN